MSFLIIEITVHISDNIFFEVSSLVFSGVPVPQKKNEKDLHQRHHVIIFILDLKKN